MMLLIEPLVENVGKQVLTFADREMTAQEMRERNSYSMSM